MYNYSSIVVCCYIMLQITILSLRSLLLITQFGHCLKCFMVTLLKGFYWLSIFVASTMITQHITGVCSYHYKN